MPAGYTLPGEPSDVFRIFAVPLPVGRTRYVRGIEFHPGNARVVHHANIRVDVTDGSRRLDAADPAPGYDGLLARSAEYPDGHFLGWTPGQIAPLVDGELAWRLDPGTDLVVQLHMQPSGKPEAVQPSIGFFFSDTPPTRTPSILRLGSQGIDIAPGDGGYAVEDRYTLPVDATLLAVQPHAHYRAADVSGTATFPDGIDAHADPHRPAGTSAGSTSTATPRRSACPRARPWRCATSTTTRRRTRATRRSRRRACAGGSGRSTRWATCGSSSPPTARPTGRCCAARSRPR